MIINEKSQTELSSFHVVFKGSVLNENRKSLGLNHLAEHLLCKSFLHLYDDFDRYSISWNAYTSENEIVYYMSGLDEYINKYKYQFLEALLQTNITEEEFETEKKVVIQEYQDCFQDQHQTLYYNILREEYGNYGAIGKLEALKKVKYSDFMKYWKKYLSKPSMVINISKDNDFVGKVKFNTEYKKEFTADPMDKLKLESKMKFKKSGVAGFIKVNEDFNYISYVLNMLGNSLKSPFFTEIRENRGLTYGISTGIEKISDTQGLAMTSLITTPENVQEVLDTYKMILTNKDKYLTQERFDIIKDNYIIRKKKNEIESYKYISKYINTSEWRFDTIIDDITFEKTQEIFDKYLTFDKWTWKVN